MRPLCLLLLAACADRPVFVTDLDVGRSAVAIARDGRTGTLGIPDGARPLGDWDRIQVETETVCALEAGGRPDCWVAGTDTLLSSVPAGPFQSFSIADGRGIFVFDDGSVIHWPQREHALPTDGPWVSVAAVGGSEINHPGACGVDEAGQLWCGAVATAAPGGPWAAVSRTGATLCAMADQGDIGCFDVSDGTWGDTGGLTGPFDGFDVGAAGGLCAWTADGRVTCIGIGDGVADWSSLAPAGTGHDTVALSANATWGCTVRDGEAACFGAPDAVPDGRWAW